MRWGTENEPDARRIYELKTGRRVVEVGLCKHPTIAHFAASPDGYYYDENKREKGVIEIKSVGTATYAKYFHEIKDNDTLLSTEPITKSCPNSCALKPIGAISSYITRSRSPPCLSEGYIQMITPSRR